MPSAAEPRHIVVADTCSFLDVVRAAERDRSGGKAILAAEAVLNSATAAGDVRVALADVSRSEYEANVGNVDGSTRASLRR